MLRITRVILREYKKHTEPVRTQIKRPLLPRKQIEDRFTVKAIANLNSLVKELAGNFWVEFDSTDTS